MTMTTSSNTTGATTMLTRAEAARYLGLPITVLETAAKRGDGPAFLRPGLRHTYYRVSDLDAWLEARRGARHADAR